MTSVTVITDSFKIPTVILHSQEIRSLFLGFPRNQKERTVQNSVKCSIREQTEM